LAAVLIAVAVITAPPIAQGSYYSTTYYNIYYYDSTQQAWAKNIVAYLSRAFGAAKTTMGYDARKGKINIYFYKLKDGNDSYMYRGKQDIHLNLYYIGLNHFTSEKVGSLVAHETAHILFFNYTGADKWNSSYQISWYRTFLTEALSWYAGYYVYNSGKYTSSSAYSEIRAKLKYYYGITKTTISWWNSGYIYEAGTNIGSLKSQNQWQLRAIGWYLTGGKLTSSSSNVQRLLYQMKAYSSSSGYYLRSSSWATAQNYFESCFKYAYGRYANAGWIYCASTWHGEYKNTKYLYGSFWYSFYN